MSPENVEVVRRSTEAYNRGDFDGMLEYWAPGAVLDWSNSYGLDARVFRGTTRSGCLCSVSWGPSRAPE